MAALVSLDWRKTCTMSERVAFHLTLKSISTQKILLSVQPLATSQAKWSAPQFWRISRERSFWSAPKSLNLTSWESGLTKPSSISLPSQSYSINWHSQTKLARRRKKLIGSSADAASRIVSHHPSPSRWRILTGSLLLARNLSSIYWSSLPSNLTKCTNCHSVSSLHPKDWKCSTCESAMTLEELEPQPKLRSSSRSFTKITSQRSSIYCQIRPKYLRKRRPLKRSLRTSKKKTAVMPLCHRSIFRWMRVNCLLSRARCSQNMV